MRTSFIVIVLTCLLVSSTAGVRAFCEEMERQPFTQLFEEMVIEGSKIPILRGSERFLGVNRFMPMMSKFASQAEKLVKAGAVQEIAFLISKAESHDRNEKCLALLTLARISENKQARETISRLMAADSPLDNFGAIVAVTFMQPEFIKEVVLSHATFGTYPLLAATGDKDTLEVLRKTKADLRTKPVTVDAVNRLNAAIALLDKRLSLPEEKQLTWRKYLLVLYRANCERPNFRGGGNHAIAAEALAKRGISVPAEILEVQIENRDMVAIALAGIQKEEALVGALSDVATKVPEHAALHSLAIIDSEASYKAIEHLAKPEDPDQNKSIARTLRSHASERSAALLEKLCKDEKYKDSWPAFTDALSLIYNDLKYEKAAPPAPEPPK